MPVSKDSIEGIAAFLKQELGTHSVSVMADSERDVLVFAPMGANHATFGKLEITDEAPEDHPPEVIIADLRAQGTLAHLKRDPSLRLTYSSDREVPAFERLSVNCGTNRYRITRDAGHNVRVFDHNDQPLTRMPQTLLVMDGSIFARSVAEWCREINTWRGPDQ